MTRASDTARILSGGVVINEDSNDVDLRVESNGNANMLVVDAGNDAVVVGQSAPDTTVIGTTPPFQIIGSGGNSFVTVTNRQASDSGPHIALTKSRNTTVGSHTIVQSGDTIGAMVFQADDGTNLDSRAAEIRCKIDTTPGENDVPGRLEFLTTADGANSPTERMRIHSGGAITAGTTSVGSHHFVYEAATGGNAVTKIRNSSANTSNQICLLLSINERTDTNSAFLQGNNGFSNFYLFANGTHSFTSDENAKKNIETTRDGYLEDLAKLRVVKYNWKEQKDGEDKELGLIAQEVEKVFPKLVMEDPQDASDTDETKFKMIKTSVLPMMLLKALQEANTKITALEARIATLESK